LLIFDVVEEGVVPLHVLGCLFGQEAAKDFSIIKEIVVVVLFDFFKSGFEMLFFIGGSVVLSPFDEAIN
jgi:hypothetical protein